MKGLLLVLRERDSVAAIVERLEEQTIGFRNSQERVGREVQTNVSSY